MSEQFAIQTEEFESTNDRLDSILDRLNVLGQSATESKVAPVRQLESVPDLVEDDVEDDIYAGLYDDPVSTEPDISEFEPELDTVVDDLTYEESFLGGDVELHDGTVLDEAVADDAKLDDSIDAEVFTSELADAPDLIPPAMPPLGLVQRVSLSKTNAAAEALEHEALDEEFDASAFNSLDVIDTGADFESVTAIDSAPALSLVVDNDAAGIDAASIDAAGIDAAGIDAVPSADDEFALEDELAPTDLDAASIDDVDGDWAAVDNEAEELAELDDEITEIETEEIAEELVSDGPGLFDWASDDTAVGAPDVFELEQDELTSDLELSTDTELSNDTELTIDTELTNETELSDTAAQLEAAQAELDELEGTHAELASPDLASLETIEEPAVFELDETIEEPAVFELEDIIVDGPIEIPAAEVFPAGVQMMDESAVALPTVDVPAPTAPIVDVAALVESPIQPPEVPTIDLPEAEAPPVPSAPEVVESVEVEFHDIDVTPDPEANFAAQVETPALESELVSEAEPATVETPKAPTSIFGSALSFGRKAIAKKDDEADGWVSHHGPSEDVTPFASSTSESEAPAVDASSTYDAAEDPQWSLDEAPISGSIFDQTASTEPAAEVVARDPAEMADEVEQVLGEMNGFGSTDPFAALETSDASMEIAGLGTPLGDSPADSFSALDADVSDMYATDEDLPLPDFTGVYNEPVATDSAVPTAIESNVNSGIAAARGELDSLRPQDELEEADLAVEEKSKGANWTPIFQLILVIGFGVAVLVAIWTLDDPAALEDMRRAFNDIIGRN